MLSLKWFAALLIASTVEAGFGEHIKNTNNEVIIDDLKEAAACLGAWCRYNLIEAGGKVQCVHKSAVVYVCNYGNDNRCLLRELEEKHNELYYETGSMTGWWYKSGWAKTIGWDRWCPDGTCDHGFAEKRGQHCTNTRQTDFQVDLRWDPVERRITQYRTDNPLPDDSGNPRIHRF